MVPEGVGPFYMVLVVVDPWKRMVHVVEEQSITVLEEVGLLKMVPGEVDHWHSVPGVVGLWEMVPGEVDL